MKKRDFCWLASLAGLGAFIWLRDPASLRNSSDSLPILAALPLGYWIGGPWKLSATREKIARAPLVIGCVCTLAGVLGDLTFAFALGWTSFLWAWLRSRVAPEKRAVAFRLLVLPLLAFPWILRDCQPLAWWFRLSAAAVAQTVFSAIGFTATREGTNLFIQGTPIAVAPACAGIETLQAMLIAGCAPAFFCFGAKGGAKYWCALLSLFALSWLANTARVLTIAAAAISFGTKFAMGAFHDFGGWLVLFVMFGLGCGAFSLASQLFNKSGTAERPAA